MLKEVFHNTMNTTTDKEMTDESMSEPVQIVPKEQPQPHNEAEDEPMPPDSAVQIVPKEQSQPTNDTTDNDTNNAEVDKGEGSPEDDHEGDQPMVVEETEDQEGKDLSSSANEIIGATKEVDMSTTADKEMTDEPVMSDSVQNDPNSQSDLQNETVYVPDVPNDADVDKSEGLLELEDHEGQSRAMAVDETEDKEEEDLNSSTTATTGATEVGMSTTPTSPTADQDMTEELVSDLVQMVSNQQIHPQNETDNEMYDAEVDKSEGSPEVEDEEGHSGHSGAVDETEDQEGEDLNSSTTGTGTTGATKEIDEDLEDGELEDEDDDEPVVIKIQPTPDVVAITSSKSSKQQSSKSKDKDKDKDKEKDRHSGSGRRRGSGEKDKKRSHHHHGDETKSKKSKLDPPALAEAEDDEEYLFVRGGSPSHAGDNNYAGGFHPDEQYNAAGSRPAPGLFDVVLEEDAASPPDGRGKHMNEGRGGRRQRSPPGSRRRRDENAGRDHRQSQRGGSTKSSRKEPPSMGDKMIHSAKNDQICSYYMQGKCQKSHEECSFSHNAVPPRKMELCKFWMMECCAKKEKCLYLHNDFPCKYYHTGLICKMGEKCKFSHKPLNEVTKAVLLKHIETAPKEILGDFPRLNRNGALTLINKMEARIMGKLKREKERKEKAKHRDQESSEREQADHHRRSRWEQPTSDDNEKLQELMKEAGIEGFYKETLEGVSDEQESPQRHQHRDRRNHHNNDYNNSNSSHNQHQLPPRLPLLHPPPPINTATMPPAPSRFQPHHIVHHPALANVLANLNIPSSTIDTGVQQQQPPELSLINGALLSTPPPSLPINISPPKVHVKQEGEEKEAGTKVADSKEPVLTEPPEHLPPMQRELFLRIQQQQLKHDNKQKSPEEEEEQDDRGWYSSDEEEEKETAPKKKDDLDFSSVISAIRQTAAASSDNTSQQLEAKGEFSGGDVDLRHLNNTPNNSQRQSQPHGPFGDTDFRLPSHRPEFKNIDLRLSNMAAPSAGKANTSSPPPVLFKSLPTGPAKEIDASLKSHPPMTWKVYVVHGVGKPDYTYIRHTLQPSQILMDPRLGPRPNASANAVSVPDLSGPASPPQQQQQMLAPPATIPGGDLVVDPRVNRRNQQAQGPGFAGPGLLGEAPRFARDPRGGGASMLPTQTPGWPTNIPPPDLTSQAQAQAQAALAAQFLAAQQLGLPLPFPFPGTTTAGNLPFGQDFANLAGQQQQQQQNQRPPMFSNLNQGGGGGHGRGNQHGRGGGSSSWERYTQGGNQHHHQQHHTGLSSPPL